MKYLLVDFFRSIAIRSLFLLSLTEMLVSLPALAQVTRYVSTTGTNANPATATSWATSTTNLQDVIDASTSGDQVWVASGTYKPGGNGHSNRDLSFAMKNGVAIYGGFLGTETNLNQRPLITVSTPSATTLSGDVGILNNPTDNSFHVFNNPAGLTNSAILNGFVLVGGYTSGASPETYGGGMYNKAVSAGQVCSPHIINCLFDGNIGSEGGGMYNNGSGGGISNPKLTNCVFRNNTATGVGGAVLNDGGGNGTCNPVFINCLFEANTARDGGAMYNYGQSGTCSPQLINCTLRNNSATAAGGGMYNSGFDGLCLPTITNCILFGNGGANTFANVSTTGASASYSLFEPSVTGYASITGNISTNTSPFSAPSGGQVLICSPVVNAGDPATTTATVGLTDLSGNPRFFSTIGTPTTRIDIGAYEVQTHPTVAITNQPATNSIGCVGGTVTTIVSLSGTALSFQWYKSGTAVAGQTSATLTLTNLQSGSAGSYFVAITGNCNSLTSNTVNLTIKPVPTRLYVRPSLTANANQTGLSWTDAFPDLQWALNYSCSNNLSEIWVATGLYKPTGTTDRTVSFAMKPNVAIYGGFLGSETALNQRVITYPSGTTLSGDIGAAGTADNSYHVINNPTGLTTGTPDRTAILDGFLITGGNANGSTPNNNGGGMLNTGSNPTIRNCTFLSNLAINGGGIYNGTSMPGFTNCSFQNNGATNGGALFNTDNSSPQLTNCSFLSNSASSGGALFNNNSSNPQLVNCVLFNNGGSNTFSNVSATVTARYSFFEPSVTGYVSVTGNLSSSISPFVSASSVQLKNGSPAVNSGDPATTTATVGATDLAGNPRFYASTGTPAGRIDMGAYELQEVLEIYTLTTGNWNDPAVWSVARLPQLNERVRLKHQITIPVSYLALGGVLLFDPASKLIYSSGGRLQMGQ